MRGRSSPCVLHHGGVEPAGGFAPPFPAYGAGVLLLYDAGMEAAAGLAPARGWVAASRLVDFGFAAVAEGGGLDPHPVGPSG